MQLLEKQVMTWFPTCVFAGRLSDISACDRIEKKLRELQASGQGTTEPLTYISPDDIQKYDEMKEIVDLVMSESATVLDFYRIKRQSHYITNMWANITHPNHRHHLHLHPNCLLSGILYVKAPPDCAPTVFEDPRPASRVLLPSYIEINNFNSSRVIFPATKGVLLMWPSYLQHAVDVGRCKTDEDRITLAFNVMIRGTMDAPTARLELS
jgi:uncharacterized protein (TIGR02466 family)